MKTVLAAAAALLMFSVPGLAADVEAPAGYDWTGAYIGAQAGYGWGDTDYSYDPANSTVGMDVDGFVGGVTSGYNLQTGQFVIGAEVDVSYADLKDNVLNSNLDFPAGTPCVEEGCSLDIDWFVTARIRLGYAMDTLMPFVTGGLAFAGVESGFDVGACTCKIDDTAFGWTIGGGLEWAFDERWSAKAEYLYVDLGEPNIDGDPVSTGEVSTSSFDFSVVRLGVNYRL